jgi:O-antigen ligase
MSGASLSHVSDRPRLRALGAAVPWEGSIAAVGAAVGIGAIAATNGGYFPTSWGWSALGFAWVAAVAVAVKPRTSLAALDRAAVGTWIAVGAWIWLSLLWSDATWRSVLEGERVLVYVAAVAAALLVVSRASVPALLGGILGATSLISSYSLATRVLPDRIGVFDTVAGYRLATPIGYWNALGIFAVIGALLAAGFAARARTLWARALSTALLVVLVPTLYFTFSRGAWLALACGIVAALVLAPGRIQLATALLLAAPAPALAVAVASRSDALTHSTSRLAAAAHDGHRLALVLVPLALAAAALAALRTWLEGRTYPANLRLAYGGVLLAIPVVVLVVVFARYGGPGTLAHKAYSSFKAPPAYDRSNLNSRLFSLTSNGRLDAWGVAHTQWHHHRLLGSGAGTFEPYWYAHRPTPLNLRDVHNLYLETLTELGVVGLALLALALAVPLAAAARARRHPLVPLAFGAYVAYVVHGAVDWDWEVPAVTVAALLVGVGLVAAARREDDARPGLNVATRAAGVAAAIVVAGVAILGLLSNVPLAKSDGAANAGKLVQAALDAKRARRWAPWSPEPWERLGNAATAAGYDDDAAVAYRKALAKDAGDWTLWFDLATVAKGAVQRHAIAEVRRLNPRDPGIVRLSNGASG